jgi:hypothetical protein
VVFGRYNHRKSFHFEITHVWMLPLLTDDFGRIFLDSYQFTVTVLHENVCNMSVHASEGSGTDDSIYDHTSAQRSRGRRSKVWEHFESDLVNVEGDLKAVCKYCRLQLHTKSGTSSLRGHIADSCPIILVNFCIHAEILSTSLKTLICSPG